MKAVILAGGKGTRGKPYTEYFPKAMTPINGKPMIDYIVKYLKSFSFVDEVIIISDYNGLGGQSKTIVEIKKTLLSFKIHKVEQVEIYYTLQRSSKMNRNLCYGL